MKHIMIDIETFANITNSVIVSIGAVKFDIKTGEMFEEFYLRVDPDSCLKAGFEVTGSTIKWWLTKSEEARKEIAKSDASDIMQALQAFSAFIGPDDVVWSNGLRFDVAILENAYRRMGWERTPWKFTNEMDVRTLVVFAPEIKEQIVAEWKGVLHNAIADCKLQIKYCSAIWNKFKA